MSRVAQRECRVDRLIVAIDPGKVAQSGVGDRRGRVGRRAGVVADVADGLDRLGGVGRRRRCAGVRARGDGRRCIGRGRPSSSGAGRDRCGCSRRRRRRPRGRSSGRGGSRPTIVTARRWSGSLARAPGGRRATSGSRRCCAAVSHRRQLVLALKPLRQRLHDQLNALAPGLSAPGGHGRALALETPTGPRGAGLRGRVRRAAPPSARSLQARADGRLSDATAAFWAERWKRLPGAARGRRAARRAAGARPRRASTRCARTSPSSTASSSSCSPTAPARS